jgi:hypothetical protein
LQSCFVLWGGAAVGRCDNPVIPGVGLPPFHKSISGRARLQPCRNEPLETRALAPEEVASSPPRFIVESRRGAVAVVSRWLMAGLSLRRLNPVWRSSVSSSRSSNRTGAFRASGSRRKVHGVAHGKLLVRVVIRARPSLSCREASGYFLIADPCRLCLARSHLNTFWGC